MAKNNNQVALDLDLEIGAIVQKYRDQYGDDFDIIVPYRVKVAAKAVERKHSGVTHKLAIQLVAEPNHAKEATA